MAFCNNAYATVWEVRTTHGNSMNVRISTSYKDKNTQQYVCDFSEYVFFSGSAARKAANLKAKDRIKLLQTTVSSKWDKDKKVNRFQFSVWDFEPAGSGRSDQGPGSGMSLQETPADDPDELPF